MPCAEIESAERHTTAKDVKQNINCSLFFIFTTYYLCVIYSIYDTNYSGIDGAIFIALGHAGGRTADDDDSLMKARADSIDGNKITIHDRQALRALGIV